jgi:hypothetical protein
MRGYVLSLDLNWTPSLSHNADEMTFNYNSIIDFVNRMSSSAWAEKLVLLGILVFSALGAQRLFSKSTILAPWIGYFVGVAYIVNPFVYTRFMVGQWLVLAGYALLPWFVDSLWSLLKNPNRRTSVTLAAWATAVGIVSIHDVFFMFLITLVSVLVAVVQPNSNHLRGKWIKYGAMALGAAILASSYWLVPMMLGTSHQAQEIATFSSSDTALYQTDGGSLGLPANVFALSGFWGDRLSQYELPWDMVSWWIVPAISFMLLAVGGLIISFRRRERIGISLGIVALIAGILAMGDAWPPTAGLWHDLVRFVPLFAGYREPEKFVALVALGEVYLTARAVGWGAAKLRDKAWAPALIPVVFALPFVLAPSMVWGMHGQLKSVDYPADWYALNSKLSQAATPPKSLFLPWHGYMRLEFAGRVVANPANRFFSTTVVSGDNIDRSGERLSLASQLVLGKLIPAGQQGSDVSRMLRAAGFSDVILAKTADYTSYAWLDHQPGLKLVSDTESLRVYEVGHE